jgi:hypothetical protein
VLRRQATLFFSVLLRLLLALDADNDRKHIKEATNEVDRPWANILSRSLLTMPPGKL